MFWIKGFIGFLLSMTTSSYNFHVYTPKTTWTGARKFCKDRGGDLLQMMSSEKFDRVQRLLGNPRNDVTYWVGAKESKRRWNWAHERRDLMEETMGCYDDDLENHVYTNFTNNHPALCSGFCLSMMKRQYSGVKDHRCYCFYDIDTLRFKDISLCSNRCPGNRFQTCGGSNEINLYHNWGIVSWGLNEPSELGSGRDCAYIIFSSEGGMKWYTEECDQKHMLVCKINSVSVCSWNNETSPCYYVIKEHITWFEARKRCYWTGGYLADADIEHSHNAMLEEGVYWAGLSRIGQTWIDGTMLDLPYISNKDASSADSTSCLALKNTGLKSGWILESAPCSKTFGFICNTNVPGPSNLNKNITQNDENKSKLHEMFFHKHMKVLVVVSGTCGVLLLLFSYVIYRRRKQRKRMELKRRRHFYYILEKLNPVYGRIIPSSVQNNGNSPPGNYNNLVFEGTMKNAKKKGETIVLKEDGVPMRDLEDDKSPGYERIKNVSYDRLDSVVVRSTVEIHDVYDEVNIKY